MEDSYSNRRTTGWLCGSNFGACADRRQRPKPENLRYGGNTSCVEVRAGDSRSTSLIAAPASVRLGQQLESEAHGQPIWAHIFVSHFHWDHIQGIPFFRPLYENPSNQFRVSLLAPHAHPETGYGRADGLAVLSGEYQRDESQARFLRHRRRTDTGRRRHGTTRCG